VDPYWVPVLVNCVTRRANGETERDGYGRRLASAYGRSVIARTIAFGLAAADHEDSRFVRMRQCPDRVGPHNSAIVEDFLERIELLDRTEGFPELGTHPWRSIGEDLPHVLFRQP
jgi:hypothetical protein